ncbi:hypothetical protein [Nonomuraea sp. NEAU-A123]|uniref:hypothetical protein n=1 Tax=Nonomuraea sp. NEAU-A123 TaxID=2839649 RepID=UPI001BE468EA
MISDIFGREMLQALIDGRRDLKTLAQMARLAGGVAAVDCLAIAGFGLLGAALLEEEEAEVQHGVGVSASAATRYHSAASSVSPHS